MSQWLKQSTAATLKLGPFVDDTDGKTAETGLSIAQADIRLAKAGGDFAQSNNVAGATHDENGYYDVPLDTTDTNTLGRLRVAVSKSGALPVWQDFVVVAANVFDSLVGGGDTLDVNAAAIANGAISSATFALGAINEDAIAANSITSSELAASAVQAIAAAILATPANLLVTDATGRVTVGSNADKTGYALTQAFPANFSSLSVDGSGRVTLVPSQIVVKKNTALANFMFVMNDSVTHTPKTGLAVTATRSIDGGAFGAAANPVVEVSNGWYAISMAAADLNGTVIAWKMSAALADQTNFTLLTQP